MTAVALLLVFLVVFVIGMTTFACIQVTHVHNRRLKEMDHQQYLEKREIDHQQYLEKSNHQQMIENERRNR